MSKKQVHNGADGAPESIVNDASGFRSGRRLGDLSAAFAQEFVARSADSIVLQDTSGTILWMNDAAEALYGVTFAELENDGGPGRILPDFDLPQAQQMTKAQLDPNHQNFREPRLLEYIHPNGKTVWISQNLSLLTIGTRHMLAITSRDVSKQVGVEHGLRSTQAKLQHAAHHDHLTGLANRRRLEHHLGRDHLRRAAIRKTVGILQVDIDKFKEINDMLGHAAGDAMLVHFAKALRETSAASDLVCRSGGDEFIVICDDIESEKALLTRADQIMTKLRKPLKWRDRTIFGDASIGASTSVTGAETVDDLILHADQALYAAKNAGRGKVVLYTPQIGQIQLDHNRLARDIRHALVEKELEVHLQPQIDLRTGGVIRCEALLRWQHPSQGLLRPAEFFSIASDAGVLVELDYRSMSLSLDALIRIQDEIDPEIGIAINVSTDILTDENYPDLLNWAIQSRGLSAEHVTIEINEAAFSKSTTDIIAQATRQLAKIGVRVALDDFGTGFSGMALMAASRIDAVKIDTVLTQGLGQDRRSETVVASIIELARTLNSSTVAETVETEAQLTFLRKIGCDAAQGFHLVKPMAIDDALIWLRDKIRHQEKRAV